MTGGHSVKFEHVDRVVKPEDFLDGYLHVVVFGPGHGEAIVVRTPEGRIGLIDGCGPPPDSTKRGSPIFDLLAGLAVDRLLFACLTHPHKDHLLGFADLVTKYPPEHVWWPGFQERAFFDHYLQYLRKTRGDSVESSATAKPLVRELGPVVAAIGTLTDDPPKELDPRPRGQALSDWKLVLRHPIADQPPLEINSILPSSSGVRLAEQDALAALNANTLNARRAVDPNRISAALLISWGNTKILLGGDAICAGNDSFQGWKGIQFPIGKVQVAKVPHHASEGAYAEALWREMNPDLGIVTCVLNASTDQPPRPHMLATLLGHCSALALTSRPTWWNSAAHSIRAEPATWSGSKTSATASVSGALATRAKPDPAENKHQNAVVVRLDSDGNIVRVALHGDARKLSL